MAITLQQEHKISALNDLIKINRDRIAGYKKRIRPDLDDNLADLFYQLIAQSEKNVDSLIHFISLLGGTCADNYSFSGKFYHAWINFKSLILGHGKRTVLEFAENCEDVMQSAYQKVLDERDMEWGADTARASQFLQSQLEEFRASHQFVKSLYEQTFVTA